MFLGAFSKIYSQNHKQKQSRNTSNTVWLQNKSNSKTKESVSAKDTKKLCTFHQASRKDIKGVPEEFSTDSISLKGWNIN